MKRLFVAVMLPEAVCENVLRAQALLRNAMDDRGIRWTQPEQFHFTLKFLGDVAESQLPAVVEGVEQATSRASAWTLEVGGVGVFPRQRSPQVLWIGATSGVPVMQQTAQYLNEELEKQGFGPETKPYIPHLTLARMKTREGEESVAKTLPTIQNEPLLNAALGAFVAVECVLMESELRPGGAVYTPLKTFAFGSQSEYNR